MAVDYVGSSSDISFIASIFVSLSLITFISTIRCDSSGYIVLLISMLVSTTLVVVQYILWSKFPSFVYHGMNAIMGPTLTSLTVIDILAMMWIYRHGATDNARGRAMAVNSANDLATNKARVIFITGDHSDV